MSLVHRLRVSLAGSGRGPNKRCYYAAVQGAPSMKDWIETLQKPGGAGGMACEIVDWQAYNEQYRRDCAEAGREPTTEAAEQRATEAAEDHTGIVKQHCAE